MIRRITDASPNGRAINPADPFEALLDRTLADAIRNRPGFWRQVSDALVNVAWHFAASPDGVAFDARGAADLIAAIIGKGSYLAYWEPSRPGGCVTDEIATALGREFWLWRPIPA